MGSWKYRYQHIPLLITMKPTPRILLGQRLYWTEKEDGSCMAIWMKDDKLQISSRNQEESASDLVALVKRTEEYSKVLKLLEENPQFVIYVEACRKGRSVTGIKVYDRDILFIFDIYDKSAEKFLPYICVHQHAFHHGIPIVKLYAETRHRSMKDLLKFRNHVLGYCEAVKQEGMVIKAYKIPERFQEWGEFKGGMIQAKVKLDVPEPTKRKIAKGEPIYPPIPENEIMGCIDKAWQELGTEKFMKTEIAMPLIAKYVGEACRQHLFSKPKTKLFHMYKEYTERLI